MRELTEPVDLCLADGRLDPRAIGWSRRPLHRCNLRGHWPRKKRWDYWCVASDELVAAITWADVDYLALAAVSVLDLASGALVEETALVLPGGAFGERPGARDLAFERRGLTLAIEARGAEMRLCARGRRCSFEFTVAPPSETINVVVPWSASRFQFTSKQVGLAARGRVMIDGRERAIDRAFAVLDFGRGIWPHRTRWHWAAAAGASGGRAVAFNLGGEWTRGTGATENALVLDGRVHKLDEEIDFGGGRLRSPRVALTFTPRHARRLGRDAWPLGARLDWAYGSFHGTVRADDGESIAIDGLPGWLEEVRARW